MSTISLWFTKRRRRIKVGKVITDAFDVEVRGFVDIRLLNVEESLP